MILHLCILEIWIVLLAAIVKETQVDDVRIDKMNAISKQIAELVADNHTMAKCLADERALNAKYKDKLQQMHQIVNAFPGAGTP